MERGTPEYKAIMTLIHDHNGSSGTILNMVKIIQKCIETGDTACVIEWLERIKDGVKGTQNAVDAYYIKAKNNFK